MSYPPYTPDTIQSMFFRWYNVKPYVYDPNIFTAMEMIGQAIEKVNEVIKETNDMGQALLVFENYVLNQLQTYDQKIIDEVTKVINEKIADGTLEQFLSSLFDGVNQKINDIEDNIVSLTNDITDINYKTPSITLSTQPELKLYNVGESINSIVLNFAIVLGTKAITKIEVYKNDILINTLQPNITSFTDGSIIAGDTKYFLKIYDGKTIIKSNELNYNFVNNYINGVLSDGYVLNNSLLNTLNKTKTIKDNITKVFNCNNQKIIFGYPKSYGDLVSIISDNKIDYLESFEKQELLFNGVSYNIYISSNFITDNNIGLSFNIQDINYLDEQEYYDFGTF